MAAPKTNQHASSANSGCIKSDECQFCTRKGLPILPVRLAVCKQVGGDTVGTPVFGDKVKDITDLTLDQTLKNGSYVSKSTGRNSIYPDKNEYIWRQLREGYLYLYDQDCSREDKWICYKITSDSKFYRFPSSGLGSCEEKSFPKSCTRKEHSPEKASLITIPNPDESGIIYFAYTDAPWSKEHLATVASDQKWRDKNMQQFNIKLCKDKKIQKQKFVYKFDDNCDYITGILSTDYINAQSLKGEKLYAGDIYSSIRDIEIDSFNDLQGFGVNPSIILSVKDEIGIIDELNANRHEAIVQLQNTVINFDKDYCSKEEAIKKDQCEEYRRKILCKQAIDRFSEYFKKGYGNKVKKDDNSDLESELKKWNDFFDNSSILNLNQEKIYRNEGKLDRAKESHQAYLDVEEARKNKIEEIKEDFSSDRHKGNLNEKINDKVSDYKDDIKDSVVNYSELEYIYNQYINKVENYREELFSYDSDYSCWVDRHIKDVIDRYSTNDYGTGLSISALITNVLRGGIQSEASENLWEALVQEIGSKKSIIIKALFSNHDNLIDKSLSIISSLNPRNYLSGKVIDKWLDITGDIQDNAQSPIENIKIKKDDIINKFRPVQGMLGSILSRTFSTLAMYEKSGIIKCGMQEKLWKIINFEILAYNMDPDVISGEKKIPIVYEKNIKLSDYLEWLYVSCGVNKAEKDDTGRYRSLNGDNGNHYMNSSSDDAKSRVRLLNYSNRSTLKNSDNSDGSYIGRDDTRTDDLIANAANVSSYIGNNLGDAPIDALKSGTSQSLGKAIAFLLASYNSVELYEDGFKENNRESFLKILSFSVSIGSVVQNAVEGTSIMRSIIAGTPVQELTLINSRGWLLYAKGLDAIAAAMSVIDGYKKLMESFRAAAQGRPVTADHLLILGAVSIAGGVAILVTYAIEGAAGGPWGLAVGAVVGAITLLFTYWLATLVAPAVEQWINRSIVGKNEGDIEKFEDSTSELNALKMTMQGVYVEIGSKMARIDWSDCEDADFDDVRGGLTQKQQQVLACQTKKSKEAYDSKNIWFNISIPKLDNLDLTVEFSNLDKNINIFKWKFKKIIKTIISFLL